MPANSGLFPALNLYPLNDSFVPKHIVLAGGQRVKVGRQTSAKTIPGDRNGYFDSKVLSRQHAEVWEENGKIWIKDVKSSNGTFINGTRLSQEGVESAPFELNTGDQVEFGIDIVGEDNQTIIHHKVAARVQCILTQEDLNEAQQAAYTQQAQHQGLGHPQQNHLPQGHPGQRRPSLHGAPNHQGSLGALAPVGRVPNKSGLSFDLILSRLQNEVQRSRETSAELHSLTAAMSEIHDSLGGVSAQAVPAYPHILPPVRHDADPIVLPAPQQDTAVITTIQEQLHQTQSILSNHVEKIQNLGLESIVGEHNGIKQQIGVLRDLIDQQKHDLVLNSNVQRSRPVDEDDDDARSISTVGPGEQFVDELDDENLEERRQRSRELGRPRTPEPTLGLDDSDGEDQAGVRVRTSTIRRNWDAGTSRSENDTAPSVPVATQECVDRLASRLEQLTAQFESAMEQSRELQAKQLLAQEQIASLQAKVEELEANKESSPASEAEREDATNESTPTLVSSLLELTKNLEGRWDRHQEQWEAERERLKATKEEWEKRVRRVEEDLVGVREIAAAASTSATHANTVAALAAKEITTLRAERQEDDSLGDADASEFAPPSPRSISSDILRQRKKSTRQRSRSRSRSPTRNIPNGHPVNEEDTIQPYSPTSINSGPYAANGQAIESNGYNSDGRRLPSSMKGLDPPSRSDSMSSPSDQLTVPSQRSDMPLSVIPAAATLFVAIAGIAAWTAATHMHT